MRGVLATFVFALSFAAVALAQPVSEHHHQSFHRENHREKSAHREHPHHAAAKHHEHVSHDAPHAQRTHHLAVFSGRPAQWCGWFMRQVFGVADRAYDRALTWTHWGRQSDGPQLGAVIVWRHHVGLIEGGPDKTGRWLVRSGNDNHAVRTRYQSIKGAVAFRMPDRW